MSIDLSIHLSLSLPICEFPCLSLEKKSTKRRERNSSLNIPGELLARTEIHRKRKQRRRRKEEKRRQEKEGKRE